MPCTTMITIHDPQVCKSIYHNVMWIYPEADNRMKEVFWLHADDFMYVNMIM